ncbi:leucine-rich repeat domain-containing protein, partial [Photobacterium damselae]|uniref:leucine-rich repeat domain-containing protein n=1 Tax=Photobacterium damselae TaxID=38293 RepID=UPI004068A9FE
MTKNLTVNDDKPYTLTLNDVRFDKNTGTIEEYTSDYTNIIIPDNFDGIAVTYIGEYAFYDNALTSVSIPNSVTEIGHAAFSKNALTSVAIPNSVTEIRGFAFENNAL